MATVITKEEFDADRSGVIDRALAGEEIVVAQKGRRQLRLVSEEAPFTPARRQGGTLRQFGTLGPISDEEAEEAVRSLPKDCWGFIGDEDD